MLPFLSEFELGDFTVIDVAMFSFVLRTPGKMQIAYPFLLLNCQHHLTASLSLILDFQHLVIIFLRTF